MRTFSRTAPFDTTLEVRFQPHAPSEMVCPKVHRFSHTHSSYSLASTKTENKSISSNEHKTTTTRRYSSEDEFDTKQDISEDKLRPRTSEDDDKQQKNFKENDRRSKSEDIITHVIGEYKTAIDVQLANTELLKSLGIFALIPDKKYEITTYNNPGLETKPGAKKNTRKSRVMRARVVIKPTKPPPQTILLNHRMPLSNFKSNKLTLTPDEIKSIRQTIKEEKKKQHLTRRNANGSDITAEITNADIIKRIEALEMDIKDFRNNLLKENNTEEIQLNNVTDRPLLKGKDYVLKMLEKYKKIDKIELNNNRNTTRNNSISSEPNITKRDAVNATIIENRNTSQVTNTNVIEAKELSTVRTGDSETTVTGSPVIVAGTTELATVLTSPASRFTTLDYSNVLETLEHINDGLDLNM